MKPEEQTRFEDIVEKHGLTGMDFLVSVRPRRPTWRGNVVSLFDYWPEVRVECCFTGCSRTYSADPADRWLEDFERDLNCGRF